MGFIALHQRFLFPQPGVAIVSFRLFLPKLKRAGLVKF
jgi:hypothetical protein